MPRQAIALVRLTEVGMVVLLVFISTSGWSHNCPAGGLRMLAGLLYLPASHSILRNTGIWPSHHLTITFHTISPPHHHHLTISPSHFTPSHHLIITSSPYHHHISHYQYGYFYQSNRGSMNSEQTNFWSLFMKNILFIFRILGKVLSRKKSLNCGSKAFEKCYIKAMKIFFGWSISTKLKFKHTLFKFSLSSGNLPVIRYYMNSIFTFQQQFFKDVLVQNCIVVFTHYWVLIW